MGVDVAIVVGDDFDSLFELLSGFLAKGLPLIALSPVN